MNIALLNVRITIQKSSMTVDGIGNHIASWEDFYSCYATVSSESPSEDTAEEESDEEVLEVEESDGSGDGSGGTDAVPQRHHRGGKLV